MKLSRQERALTARDSTIRTLLAALLLAVGSLHTGCTPAEGSRVFVVVLIDTLRRDALGCYGNDQGVSPAIDAIAAEGVRFEQAVSTAGWTLPATASLLTGAWPLIHGALGKGASLTPIRAEVPTAAEVFRDHGFATVGIANATFLSPLLGLDRGFDVYDHDHSTNSRIRRADESVDVALGYMRQRLDRDQFVFVHLFDPHLDYDPPEGYETPFIGGRKEPPPPLSMRACLDMRRGERPPLPDDVAYIRGLYHAEINFVDRQVGRFVEELKEMGVYDQTTLVILADHGEEFWDHGDFEHGHTLYDELIRIPVIVKPSRGLTPVRRVVESQVRILDIMPTLFELAGIPQPQSFVGLPLPGLRPTQETDGRIAFSQNPLYGPERVAWRTGHYKLIYEIGATPATAFELYDRRTDPRETNDLAEERPEIVQRLSGDLFGFVQDLQSEAGAMSHPEVRDMSPEAVESLKSLGYIR